MKGTHLTQDWQTKHEIFSQPDIWASWISECCSIADEIQSWLADSAVRRVWFTGAGSSAFIGETLADALTARLPELDFRSVATTDIVSCPALYLDSDTTDLLVVCLGRSGDSSESIGTIRLLDSLAPQVHRLNITCNGKGLLATNRHPGPGTQRTVVLPDACHDRGFAMTSSFTTMLLSALAVFLPRDEAKNSVKKISQAALGYLANPFLHEPVDRAVFLGSGAFRGIARESALKALELTAGNVFTSWDSCLGFRHGPKAIISENSAVFIYLSNSEPTRSYDTDIAAEIRAQFPEARVLTIGCDIGCEPTPDVVFAGNAADLWNTALFLLFAQVLSYEWSNSMGLNVDDPFIDAGNLSRVVSHVRLHA